MKLNTTDSIVIQFTFVCYVGIMINTLMASQKNRTIPLTNCDDCRMTKNCQIEFFVFIAL